MASTDKETDIPEFPSEPSVLADHRLTAAFFTDTQGACVWVNEKWCELTGCSQTDAVGDGWQRALHPDDRARIVREWGEIPVGSQIFCEEYRFLRPDGSIRWVLGRATEQFGKDGKLMGYAGVVVDVTELRQRGSRSHTALPEKDLKLSKREIQTARLLSEGLSNKQVAVKMKISVRTVEAHRSRLMRKLRLKSVAGLVRYAIATGLV